MLSPGRIRDTAPGASLESARAKCVVVGEDLGTVPWGFRERMAEAKVLSYQVVWFEREGLGASLQNAWAMEIEPGKRFLYELRRPGGRLFQVEFDLTAPVPLPPAPWGQ